MKASELMERYTMMTYVTTKECEGVEGQKWHLLPAEMTAVDAIRFVANKLKISQDKVLETRGYVKNDCLYLRKSWEKVPKGAVDVWAMSVRG